MKRKKILIFGGSGFLGSRLVKKLKSYIVVAPSHSEINLLNIKKVQKKIEKEHPDIIIYSAGVTRIDDAELQKENAFKLNAYIPEQIATFISPKQIQFIYLSTDAVFDGYKIKFKFKENDKPNAESTYGKSKLLGEKAVLKASANNTVIRLITLFGIDYKNPNFLTKVLSDLLEKRQIFGIVDQIQNPLFVDIAAEAIFFIVNKQLKGIYHLGALDWDTNYNIITKLIKMLRQDTSLIYKSSFKKFMKHRKSHRKKNSVLLCNKFDEVSDHKILKSLDDSFKFLYSSINTN